MASSDKDSRAVLLATLLSVMGALALGGVAFVAFLNDNPITAFVAGVGCLSFLACTYWRGVTWLQAAGSAVLTLIVLGYLGEQLREEWRSADDPEIVVVGPSDESGEDHDIWRDVLAGIYECAGRELLGLEGGRLILTPFTLKINEESVRISFLNDGGDPEKAREIAQELSEKENVLFVIGHLQSEVMKQVIDIYIESRTPLLMPVTTNASLTQDNSEKKISWVLRLPPTDDKQAKVLADLTGKLSCHADTSVALYRDGMNAKYSRDLGNMYRNLVQVHRDGTRIARIIHDATVSNASAGVWVTDSVAMMRPNLLVCVGMTDTSLTLIWQVRAMGQIRDPESAGSSWQPPVIITDGSVSAGFEAAANKDMRPVYATFPDVVGRYTNFGHDALLVVREVLRGARSLERQCIIEYVEEKQEQELARGRLGSLKFDKNGDRMDATFHVLELDEQASFDHAEEICQCSSGG